MCGACGARVLAQACMSLGWKREACNAMCTCVVVVTCGNGAASLVEGHCVCVMYV
jgi:hypothetical protein